MVPGSYAPAIHTNVSDGVAYANYTAHGSENGWANPSFGISDIQLLQNAHKYCLMVGNCCKTANFSVDCFAKEISRAANKGALGYIGCSDYSYWDEDFWWACGYKSPVSTNLPYDSTHLGAFDKTFHDHGEPLSEYFVTMGQMVQGGNYAVEESGSDFAAYYWETYCLMGDPSLSIYYSIPPVLEASFGHIRPLSDTSLSIITEPLSYVALSLNDSTLLDARTVDSSGVAVLTFPAIKDPCYAHLIITRQNRKPLTDSVQFVPDSIMAGIPLHLPARFIDIYPNPFSDRFCISFNSEKQADVSVEIFDAYGNCMFSKNYLPSLVPGKQMITIEATDLNPGMYFCRVQTDWGIQTKKIVLIR